MLKTARLLLTCAALVIFTAVTNAAVVHKQEGLRQVDTGRYSAGAEADRITNLPGLGKPDFGLFSG